MQLPAELREAIAQRLEGVSRNVLAERAQRISELYRAGGASAAAIRDEIDGLAYAVSRMPATYAAVRNAFERLQQRSPGFSPRSVLDLGAGPGTAGWAAVDAWPAIETIAQIDSSPILLRLGKTLAQSSLHESLRQSGQIARNLTDVSRSELYAELVVLSYALAEVSPTQIDEILLNAWRQSAGALAIVEPGTPAGYERILRARKLLMDERARIAAPCPHELRCPLISPDWCHFAQRISRTRDHMLLKSAELPYEDEKFSYLVAVREELFEAAKMDRILAPPQVTGSGVALKLCRRDGSSELIQVAKRDAQTFRRAKKRSWGDEL